METEKVIILNTAPAILSPESEYATSEDSTDTSNTSHVAETTDTEESAVTAISNDAPITAAIAETADNAESGVGIINTVDTTTDTEKTVDTVQIVNSDETIYSTETIIDAAKSVAEKDDCVNADSAFTTTEFPVAVKNEASQSTEPEVADENENTSENGSGFERDPHSGSSLDNYSETGRDSPEQDTNDDEGVGDKDHDVEHEPSDNEECPENRAECRQGGDGMERVESPQPQRKVDDDEDKNNPQYIPKRGTFYEHDYRTTEDVPDDEKADAEKEKADGSAETKKKMWHDKRENWSHDKFKDEDQTPKSRDELISIYGYDIRNEDGPPRARRRRRYGRGPNKYTRNWEDEDAYYKNSTKKMPQQRSGDQQQQESAPSQVVDHTVAYKSVQDNPQALDNVQRHESVPNRGGQGRISAGTGRIIRPNRDYSAADYKSFTKARNFNRGSAVEQQQRSHDNVGGGGGHRPQHLTPTGAKFQNRDNRNDANIANQLDVAMGSMSLQQQHNSDSNQHRPDRKPASKRYSSIRQRTLPESTMTSISVLPHNTEPRERAIGNVMPLPQQQHFYGGNEYNNTQQPQQVPQPPALQPPQTQMNVGVTVGMRPPPQLTIPSTTATAMLRQQQFPPPPQFTIGPHAPPPQFLPPPPQPPTLNINYQLPPQHYYQQPPPPPPFVAQHQVQVPAMTQPAEQLFQPQGGITYYSPEEQQTTQRHAPPVRPKVAIPILPPPPTPPPIANNNTTTSASDSAS